MPAVARSKLCNSVSTWLGVFCQYRYVIGIVALVIVFAGYLLFLFFVSLKPFSLIFIDREQI